MLKKLNKLVPPGSASRRHVIFVIIGFVVLVVGLFVFYLYQDHGTSRPKNDTSYTEATEEEKQDAEDHKQQIAKDQEKEGQPSDEPTSIGLTITRAQQTGPGQPLNIRTLISGTTSGNCIVTISKDGQPTVNKEFSVVFEATSARCANADVAASAFGASGQWQLEVVVKSDGYQSNTVKQAVEIKK